MQQVNMGSGIILFEDIDNVDAACGVKLPGDKDSRKVTLDGLLNALDGVQRGASKRIIIATTNYPEKLVPSIRRWVQYPRRRKSKRNCLLNGTIGTSAECLHIRYLS